MKKLKLLIILIIITTSNLFSQFHDYSVKYGFQGHLLVPSSEFDSDLYRLSILGRGFVKFELNSYLETEFGIAIGQLNGIDFRFKNWSTVLFPSDFRLILSPFYSKVINPYFYSGVGLLKWNVTELPSTISPNETKETGWNMTVPVGMGFEIRLGEETLLDISGNYTYAKTDDLNYFNNPVANDGYFEFGFGLTFVMGSEESDDDKDGLGNIFEESFGTDPNEFDTDFDGLSDGDELNKYETNPVNNDTDADGLPDYDEVITFKTDPNSSDSDGDDILDIDEIQVYNTDPNNKDTDNDLLSDGYEVNNYKTNPNSFDTDSDKLSDGEEIKNFNTDPLNSDSDGDGIKDGDEILVYKTNPLVKDNNKIVTTKVVEEKNNTTIEPIVIEPIINEPVAEKIESGYRNDEVIEVLDGVTFDKGKSVIKKESELTLTNTLNELKNNPELKIEIRGYTDNTGNPDINKKLSQERADAVRIWLAKKGIDALRIKAIGYGSQNPIADNSTEAGRNRNRRIEILKK